MKKFIAVLSAAFIAVSSTVRAEEAKTNSVTVVCLGDSITKAGYPEELAKLVPVRVINAGVAGNTSRQGLARLQRDVLSHKPDVVIAFFGTNDNRQDAPKIHVSVSDYEKNLTKIIEGCRAIGTKVILGTIPPIDETAYFTHHVKADFDKAGGMKSLMEQYHAAALRVAQSNTVPVVDLNQLLAGNTTWRKPDGVHPTEEGNRLIAGLFLQQVKAMIKPE